MSTIARRVEIWYPLAAAIMAGACESTSAPSPRSIEETVPVRRVVVLGDSLAVYPSRDESFPAELQARIERAGLGWTVINAGVSGDTTTGGLRRVDRLLADDVGVLVVALGANDGLRGIDLSTIESNLSTIVERAQSRNIRVLLCGMETPPAHGWDYTLAFHRIFPRLAAKYGVPLVPFLLAGVALVPDMNGADGIHPNAAGARRIADTIWPYLVALLQQESVVAGSSASLSSESREATAGQV